MKSKKLHQLISLVAIAAIFGGALPVSTIAARSLPPAPFAMQDLGAIGGNLSQGTNVNESGEVVGQNLEAGGIARAFVYRNGTMTNLPMLANGATSSRPAGINAGGDIIGNFSGNGVARGFIFKNNVLTEIPLLPTGTINTADGINDNGDVVGSAWLDGDATRRAYVYRNGVMTDIGTLGGATARANAINNNGDIVGSASTLAGQSHAFVYRNGQMTDLGTLGGTSSNAYGINSLGEIIGVSTLAGNAVTHGFVYRNGQMIDLGTLGGADSEPSGINDSGDIIGEADVAGNFGHAFVYRNGQMTDIGPAGYTISHARAINNNGDILVNGFTGLPQACFLYRGGQHINLETLGGPTCTGTDISNSGYITGQSTLANPTTDFHAFRLNSGTPPLAGKIVYYSRPQPAFLEIRSMNADGTNNVALTTSGADFDPSVSADGSKIAFTSSRDNQVAEEIFVMNGDGTGQTRLTNDIYDDIEPSISADGSRIAFSSLRDGNWEIYTMSTSPGSIPQRVTTNAFRDDQPAISPDGTKIAFRSNRDGAGIFNIYVMNADGTNQTRLTDAIGDLPMNQPSFSPDGTKIVFQHNAIGEGSEIYVMNAVDGLSKMRLTTNTANDYYPAYSPDGSRITFSSTRDGNLEIYYMNADGTNPTRLTTNLLEDDRPAWGGLGTVPPPPPTPSTKVSIAGGNLLIGSPGEGLILRSPNGTTCIKIGIDNAGAMTTQVIACP